MTQLRDRQPTENDMAVDTDAIFDEKLRHKALMLEAPTKKSKKGDEKDGVKIINNPYR